MYEFIIIIIINLKFLATILHWQRNINIENKDFQMMLLTFCLLFSLSC